MIVAKNAVPEQNSAANRETRDVIGNKEDTESGDSLYALAYIVENHIHSIQKVYPTLAASPTVTDDVAAWTLGAIVEIVPVNTITSPFDIHHLYLTEISAAKQYELVLYQGAGDVEVARVRFQGIAGGKIDHMPVQMPIIPANARIRARVASEDGGGETVDVAVAYHEY